MRVINNSASLTAVNLARSCQRSLPLTLSDLLAAGASTGLATRLQKVTGIQVYSAEDILRLHALQQCSSLTHLDISGTWWLKGASAKRCHQAGVALTAALQGLHRLTRLHILGTMLQFEGAVAALALALQPLTQLQHLHLAGTWLAEARFAALAPALSALPGLQTLNVCNNSLDGAEGAEALTTVLAAVPGLTHLDVSDNSFGDAGAAMLASALRGMTLLQTLNMHSADLSEWGAAMLAPVLAALPNLHTLDMGGRFRKTRALLALQPALARERSPLRNLGLSSTKFDAEGACALAAGLSTAIQLQELDLHCATFKDEAWEVLAPALSRLRPSLQSLKLGSADPVDSAALAAVLQTLTGLTRLAAREVFNPAAMVDIAPALMGMRRLQVLELTLRSCSSMALMTAESSAAVAAMLLALSGSLTQLTLSECRMPADAAANVLAPALAQVTGLVDMRLGGNDFGLQGARWLVPLLSALPRLRKVHLWICRLGAEAAWPLHAPSRRVCRFVYISSCTACQASASMCSCNICLLHDRERAQVSWPLPCQRLRMLSPEMLNWLHVIHSSPNYLQLRYVVCPSTGGIRCNAFSATRWWRDAFPTQVSILLAQPFYL